MSVTWLQRAQLLKTAGLPAVYAEWLNAGKEAPTVLIYGHYGEPAWHSMHGSMHHGVLQELNCTLS